MVAFEKRRASPLRATEYVPVCSDCDWRNSGQPTLTITDAAMESSTDDAIAGIVYEYLDRAQVDHRCKAGG
jgi:hypothetical protein